MWYSRPFKLFVRELLRVSFSFWLSQDVQPEQPLFLWKRGGGLGLGENCSLRSPFLVSNIWVLTHLAPKKLLFCAYPHSRFLKVLADQGSILESVFSVWMVDSKCFFFSSDTGPYVVLQATSLSLQDSLLHFSLSRFWGIPMDALSF